MKSLSVSPDPGGATVPVWRQEWALRLLEGGLVGVLVPTIVVTLVAWMRSGSEGVGSSLLAAGLVAGFFAVGQVVDGVAIRLPASTGMALVLFSFVARLLVLGAVLLVALDSASALSWVDLTWFAVAALAAVVGWVTGLLVGHHHSRIPVYDTVDDAPRLDGSRA